MNKLQALANSIIFLTISTVVLIGAMVACIFPISDFIANESTSVTTNFYYVGGFMLLLVLASAAQLLLIVRLIWGSNNEQKRKIKAGEDDLDLDDIHVRSMGATSIKKAFIVIVLISINMAIFNQLGKGALASPQEMQVYRVLTGLRSPDAQDRADVVPDAILLTGDERITEALKRVMTQPGESREWAAYMAGARLDLHLADTLGTLLREGNSRERAASAMALARLKDMRVIRFADEVYKKLEDKHQGDLIKAIGTFSIKKINDKADIEKARIFLNGLTKETLDDKKRMLVIWALGRFESSEALPFVENVMESETDPGKFCNAFQAFSKMAHAGSTASSLKLLNRIYKVNSKDRCPEIVYKDFTEHEELICEGGLITERILHAIAKIGQNRAMKEPLKKISLDNSFTKTVKEYAASLAKQM